MNILLNFNTQCIYQLANGITIPSYEQRRFNIINRFEKNSHFRGSILNICRDILFDNLKIIILMLYSNEEENRKHCYNTM